MLRPETLWAAEVSRCGLYSNDPVKCEYSVEYSTDKDTWVYDNTFLVHMQGLETDPDDLSLHIFASENKKDVENFISGVRAAFMVVGDLVSSSVMEKAFSTPFSELQDD